MHVHSLHTILEKLRTCLTNKSMRDGWFVVFVCVCVYIYKNSCFTWFRTLAYSSMKLSNTPIIKYTPIVYIYIYCPIVISNSNNNLKGFWNAPENLGYFAFWTSSKHHSWLGNNKRWWKFTAVINTFESLWVWVWNPKSVYQLQNSSGCSTDICHIIEINQYLVTEKFVFTCIPKSFEIIVWVWYNKS